MYVYIYIYRYIHTYTQIDRGRATLARPVSHPRGSGQTSQISGWSPEVLNRISRVSPPKSRLSNLKYENIKDENGRNDGMPSQGTLCTAFVVSA